MILDNSEKYKIKCLWDEKIDCSFNTIVVSKIFRIKDVCLCVGCENGQIQVFQSLYNNKQITGFQKVGRIYETKGGPIHSLTAHDVTKFSSIDILAADSKGMFTIVTNGQILNRRSICDSKISDVVIETDAVGNMCMIIGTTCGLLVATSPYDIIWRCRLNEVLQDEGKPCDKNISIECLHVLRTQTSSVDCNYIVVADSEKNIHLFQNGRLVMTLSVPSVITSMCSGYFISDDTKDHGNNPSPHKGQRFHSDKQVALSSKSGAIFILSNFAILPYFTLSYPITKIKLLSASGTDDLDSVLCIGHFNKLCILQNRVCVTTYKTEDWIHSLDVINDDSLKDSPMLVLGCLDKSVKLLQLTNER